MATVNIIGSTGFTEQVEYPVTMAPDGSGVGIVTQKAPWQYIINNIPTPLTPHPSFPSLLLYEFTINRESGGFGTVSGTYRGVLAANPFLLVQEEVSVATSAEPVETNPIFAYPPSAPPIANPPDYTSLQVLAEIQQALAQFRQPDETIIGTAPNAAWTLFGLLQQGVESYLRRGTTYRQNFCSNTFPSDYSGVGYISGNPGANAPVPPSGSATAPDQNWIQTGISWRRQGGVIYVTKEWQLSGPGGWNPILYTPGGYVAAAGGSNLSGLGPVTGLGAPVTLGPAVTL